MTISYSGNYIQLLFRWKGSMWKSVWKELLIYLSLYYMIRYFYFYGVDWIADKDQAQEYRTLIEALCRRFHEYTKQIPLTFLLGFYITNVVTRWWNQFEALPWPEDLISHACSTMSSQDEATVKRRHRIARYINLSAALAWRDISSKIRLRFPHVRCLIKAGLLTEKEFQILEDIHKNCETMRWMTPLHWIAQLLSQEEKENKLVAPMISNFVNELKLFRNSLRRLYCYDWVSVPLVYTQVAVMATFSYFFFALFGRQTFRRILDGENEIDVGFPILLVAQFLFFVGWLQVGQDLMRPFGLEDDNIELNYILDRNIQTSFTLTSRLALSNPPDFEEDPFWKKDGKIPKLPHTKRSSIMVERPPKLHSYIELDKLDPVTKQVENVKCIKRKWQKKRYIGF